MLMSVGVEHCSTLAYRKLLTLLGNGKKNLIASDHR